VGVLLTGIQAEIVRWSHGILFIMGTIQLPGPFAGSFVEALEFVGVLAAGVAASNPLRGNPE
jgi:hypothetical protein